MSPAINLLVRGKDSSVRTVEVDRASAADGMLRAMCGNEVVLETPLDAVSWWSIALRTDER